MQMHICPIKGMKTLRDTRLAVGFLVLRIGNGPAQPTGVDCQNMLCCRNERERGLTEHSDWQDQCQVYEKKL